MRRIIVILGLVLAVLGFEKTARADGCFVNSCVNDEISPGICLNYYADRKTQCGMTMCGSLLPGGYLYETEAPLNYEAGVLMPFTGPTLLSASFLYGDYSAINEHVGGYDTLYWSVMATLSIYEWNGVKGEGIGTFWRGTSCHGNTYDGGCYDNKVSTNELYVTQFKPVPEPGTFFLIGSGVFALAGVLRRKLAIRNRAALIRKIDLLRG